MKVIITFFLAFALLTTLRAQTIPNAGFESWTNVLGYESPVGYVTGDHITAIFGAPQTATILKSTDRRSGSFAIRAQVNDADSYVFGLSDKMRVTTMPRALVGYFKGRTFGTDTLAIGIQGTKWNAMTQEAEEVPFEANIMFRGTQATFTSFSANVPATMPVMPDSIQIGIVIANVEGQMNAGSFGVFDDLAFSFTSASALVPVVKRNLVKVFPNPATNYFIIEKSEQYENSRLRYTLIAADGKVVQSSLLNEPQTTIQIGSELANGVYFYQIYDEKNEWLDGGEVQIQH
jgi:hypothetical protein